MAANLPKLANSERISTNIIRILGGNPSKFTLQGSNTYLLGAGSRRMLLDTGEARPIWSKTLSRVLQDEKCTISICLLSHWHHDHVGGVNDLLTLCPDPRPTIYKNTPSLNPDGILDVSEIQNIQDGQRFSVEGADIELEAVHCPGHTKDHMAFVITSSPNDEAEVGAIFTADNVLGHGTAVFEDLAAYLSSLALMKSRVTVTERKVRAYPGHGEVIEDAGAKIEEYIQHRRMREEEAVNVLRYGTPKREEGKEVVAGKEWGSMEMVKVIYVEYPENLHVPAEWGLLMVLEKLRKDGKVVKKEEGGGKVRWKIGEKAAL